MKSNILYVFYATFSTDLLFWIVINNLFLTTVKGMSEFNVILISLLGLAFSLVLYPLVAWMSKKISNHTSIIIGGVLYVVASLLFMLCSTIYLFVLAETLYAVAALFKRSSTVMLKNNLKEQQKEDQFVKWKSYGNLGYSLITTVVAAVSGVFFNINPYLPMILGTVCAATGLVLAIFYKEPAISESEKDKPLQTKVKIGKIITNRLMVLIFFMNLITVGTYIFIHTKSTLLMQVVCEGQGFALDKISLIVSGIVLASRVVRVIANFVTPIIYKHIKRKPLILIGISVSVLFACVMIALGGNLNGNVVINLVLIAIALFTVISVRDFYNTLEDKAIVNNLPEDQQRQALVLANLYNNFGKLLVNGVSLLVLGFTSINIVFLFLIIFGVGQIFVCVPFSKYLNERDEIVKNKDI